MPPRTKLPKPTPFSVRDKSKLRADLVTANAEKLRRKLERARLKLEKLRNERMSPKPDSPARPPRPSPDQLPPPPVEPRPDPTRADLLLPFLLIRTFEGDFGARPINTDDLRPSSIQSPDIIVTTHVEDEPTVLGREGFLALIDQREAKRVPDGATYDVWVHVWNLGRAPAYGVRVRAWAHGDGPAASEVYLGGRRLDLGDRTSDTSHLVVKIGPWHKTAAAGSLVATAECITDVSNGSRDWALDRHTATRGMWLIDYLPPIVPPVG